MTSQRLGMFLAGVLTALAVVAGLWLAQRLTQVIDSPPTAAVPDASHTPKASPTPSATEHSAPPGFRLAGVAVNVDQLYAVIEAPNGTHGLYRQDEEIPGLGRLAHIAGEHVVVTTDSGDIKLWVAPAASATPTITRRPATPTPKRTPPPGLGPGGSAPGSAPSGARDRPAF